MTGNVISVKSEKPLESTRALLGKTLKCTLDDGRTVTGTFICLDRLANMILTNVIEERWVDTSDYSIVNKGKGVVARRELSQAMIPGFRLKKVEIDRSVLEETLPDSIVAVVEDCESS